MSKFDFIDSHILYSVLALTFVRDGAQDRRVKQ